MRRLTLYVCFLVCAAVALLYMWPVFIVQENVRIIQRTHMQSSCYPTKTMGTECYQGWRLAVYEAIESLLLNETLSDSYFLWALVQPVEESTTREPHWHFHQAVSDKDEAQRWVLEQGNSTCTFFVAHRLSFISFLWDLMWGTPKGPFLGLYFHLM